MSYSEKLRDPRWQKKRLEILNRDEFTCQLCGDKETTLHVHHKSYNGNPWDSKNAELTTHCEHCHLIVEFYKQDEPLFNIVKIFKYNLDSCVMVYVVIKSIDGLVHIFSFEYNKEYRQMDLMSGMLAETLDLIIKEVKVQKRKTGLKSVLPG